MNIDTRFPTKLDGIQDAQEPLRKACWRVFLLKSLSASLSTPALFSRRREIVSNRSGGDQRRVAGGFGD